MSQIRLITLDPGHFHAALVQKEMYPEVSPRAHVYAPLGQDLVDHLARVARFNTGTRSPTSWELEVHAGPDPLGRLLAEKPGDVVIFSGRNRAKIDGIVACLEAGLHVLADKPWIIRPEDFGRLEAALETAGRHRVVAYDIMTERYEITSILQRALVSDPAVFGEIVRGTPEEPGVYMESVHHLLKLVAGVPNLRPAWFFDIGEQGEALADAGTHLADLAQWTLFPDRAPGWRADLRLTAAQRWPTVLTAAEFSRATGEKAFPDSLQPWVKDGRLDYFCNTRVCYSLGGVVVKLDVLWRYEAAQGGGDTHLAVYRGTRSRVEVRQQAEERGRPEVYVVPGGSGARGAVRAALERRLAVLAPDWPGLEVQDAGERFRIAIPDRYRVGHEAHFAQVARQFFAYVREPASLPAWENPAMLAKYALTTGGVALSRGEAALGGGL